jgi:putative membrane protein (TIGR04086 family)
MPFHPIISQPSRRALLRGVATMLLVYAASMIVLNLVLRYSSIDADPDPNDIAAEVIPLLAYFTSGFVAGFVARRSPLMNGALLGFVIASMFLVPPLLFVLIPQSWIQHPFNDYFDELSWFAFLRFTIGAMLVCSLAAILGDYVSTRRKAP